MTVQDYLTAETIPPASRMEETVPRGGWGARAAGVISQVGSPPVMVPLTMSLQAAALRVSLAWAWTAVYTLLAIVAPVLYLVWLLARGHVSDLDVRIRSQRVRPMFFTLLCAGGAWLALWAGAAPRPMVTLAGAAWAQTAIICAITLRWKISVHCAAAATAAGAAWYLTGSPFPLCVGVPLIAWSRLRLRRHTLPQTIAGAALGLLTAILTFA